MTSSSATFFIALFFTAVPICIGASCQSHCVTHGVTAGELVDITAANIALLDGHCSVLLLALPEHNASSARRPLELMQRVATALAAAPRVVVAVTRLAVLRRVARQFARAALPRPRFAPGALSGAGGQQVSAPLISSARRGEPTAHYRWPLCSPSSRGVECAPPVSLHAPLYFFDRRPIDRRCLLSPSPYHRFDSAPTAGRPGKLPSAARRAFVLLDATVDARVRVGVDVAGAADALALANGHFGTHRALSGILSPLGAAIDAVQRNRFRPPPPPPRASARLRTVLRGEPARGASAAVARGARAAKPQAVDISPWSCERLDARTLSPVDFARRFVFGSRPVVLTHAMAAWSAAASDGGGSRCTARGSSCRGDAAAAPPPWSAARLRACCANATVQVKATPDG